MKLYLVLIPYDISKTITIPLHDVIIASLLFVVAYKILSYLVMEVLIEKRK